MNRENNTISAARRGMWAGMCCLPGDPFRTDLIAAHFQDAKLVAHNREHKTWTGHAGTTYRYRSHPPAWAVPSAAIAVEELNPLRSGYVHSYWHSRARFATNPRIRK